MKILPSDIKFYLDSNIIVAYYFDDDDANQHKRILECFSKLSSRSDVLLIASTWTMIEADNAIKKRIREKVKDDKIADYERKKANKFIIPLWKAQNLGNINFKIQKFSENIIDAEFLHIEDFLGFVDDVAPLGNLRDALHCVIMNHFKIKKILTFNKKHFQIFENAMRDIEAVNPDDIDKYIHKAPTKEVEEIKRGESDSRCDVGGHLATDYKY